MANKSTKPPPSKEDEIGRKWDRCITDMLLKSVGGVAIGCLVSLIFAKKKAWPIWLGSGFGVGMGYSNCERDLNLTITAPCPPPVGNTKRVDKM